MGWLVGSVSGFPGPQCQHDGPLFKQLTFRRQPPHPRLLGPHSLPAFLIAPVLPNPHGEVKEDSLKEECSLWGLGSFLTNAHPFGRALRISSLLWSPLE